MKMYFTDICVELGQPGDGTRPWLPETEIEALYRKHGIAWGLAYHSVAREYDAYTGNQRLLAAIEGRKTFRPLMTVALNQNPDVDPVKKQIAQTGLRLVIVFPKEHGYCLDPWVVDRWMNELARRKIAVAVHMNQTNWPEITAWAREYPKTNIVVLGTRYHDYAMLHNAMSAYPNLMLDISQFHVFNGMRRLVVPYGSHRLFFGSGLPLYSPGSPRFQLLRGGLGLKETCAIAHGNLERLLGVKHSQDAHTTEATIPCPIIDMHAHSGTWPRYGMGDHPRHDIVTAVERAGVEMACVNSIFEAGRPSGNDTTAHFIATRPGRFLGVAKINPFFRPTEIVAELERCRVQYGFRGIKIYPPHDQIPLDDPRYLPAYRFVHRHRWHVLYHGAPGEIPVLAKRFKNAFFICGHSVDYPEAQEWARTYPNVYVEICNSTRRRASWVKALQDAPADKILFGSDFTLLDPAAMAGAVMDAVDDPARLVAIFRHNACRILGLNIEKNRRSFNKTA